MSDVSTLGPEAGTANSSAALTLPERSRSELLIALALLLGACLYLWPLRDFVSFNADEGITLVSADRILRGQVPYRDFFTFITPGSPYLMALWFKLFGASFTVARSILLGYAGIFAAITYLLTRRVYHRSAALFAAAMLILGCMPFRFLVIHNWDSTLFALLSIYCAQRVLETNARFWCFFVGLGSALTCLTEQSKGAGLLLGLGIAAALLLPPRERWHKLAGNLCWTGAGFVIPLALTFAYFASQHATAVMLRDCLWPMQHYSVVNRLTYGTVPMRADDLRDIYSSGSLWGRILAAFLSAPIFLVSTLALLVIASTVYAVVLRRCGGASQALGVRILGGSVFFGVFLSTLATGRADTNHLLYLTPLFMYLVPSVLDINHRKMRFLFAARPMMACILLVSFAGFGLITVLKAAAPAAKTKTRRGVVRLAYPDEVLAYVEENGNEGQQMYVHPYQALYSFLSGTVNPTHVNFLQPGMSTADQYEMTVGDLAVDRPPVVLFDPNFGDKISTTWPSTPAEALARDPVADYLFQHYSVCRFLNSNPHREWSFYYMVRNDLACPAIRSGTGK